MAMTLLVVSFLPINLILNRDINMLARFVFSAYDILAEQNRLK